MSLKTKALFALTFASGVAVTLLSTINHDDFHTFHATRPHSSFVNVEPGAFYEVNQGVSRVCHFAEYAKNFRPEPPRLSRRYYNILGKAVPVLPVAYRYVGFGEETSHPQVELDLSFYEATLRPGFYGQPSENCYERIRVASERGSVICIVDAVYHYADSGAPFAVKFKEFTFAPAAGGDGAYPRCPLAGPRRGLASLKRGLIAFTEALPDGLLGQTEPDRPKV